MLQLMQEEVPIDEAQLSPELVDFVRRCMHRDPWQRPSAEELQRHPFIRKVVVMPPAVLGGMPAERLL